MKGIRQHLNARMKFFWSHVILVLICNALHHQHQQRHSSRLVSMSVLSDDELSGVFNDNNDVTILGFGSLLSETSSRGTFPNLKNFREVRVKDYARKFQHPAFIFFKRGIADLNAKTYASLSTEPCPGAGFNAVAFEIAGETKDAWLRREEEFEFHYVDFIEGPGSSSDSAAKGIMCCAPTMRDDSIFRQRWGEEKYEESLREAGLHGIWDRELNRGVLPCSVYLRHCVLACKSRSKECADSFLDETKLESGVTVRAYLELNPWIMDLQPPESVIGRYSG